MMHALSINTTSRLVNPPTSKTEEETGYSETNDGISAMTDNKTKPPQGQMQSAQAQLSQRKKRKILDTNCTVLKIMFRKVIVKADHWKELELLLVYLLWYCSI